MEQSSEPVASISQPGKIDPVVQLMEKYDIPQTRENYLYYAYMGEVPDEIGAEVEEALPEQFRLKD